MPEMQGKDESDLFQADWNHPKKSLHLPLLRALSHHHRNH